MTCQHMWHWTHRHMTWKSLYLNLFFFSNQKSLKSPGRLSVHSNDTVSNQALNKLRDKTNEWIWSWVLIIIPKPDKRVDVINLNQTDHQGWVAEIARIIIRFLNEGWHGDFSKWLIFRDASVGTWELKSHETKDDDASPTIQTDIFPIPD